MNLQRELEQINEKHTNSNEIKKNVLLLEETSQVERELLREAGLSGMFDKIDKQEAVRLTRIKKQEEFNTKLYTLEEIKDLCIKYRLRFLHSKEFHGKIDPKLGKKLVEYLKERNVVGSLNGEANTNLFILAKKRDFNFEQKENLKPVNPILFYQVDTKEGKMYSVVTKWGRSFGIERIILGIMLKNSNSLLISLLLCSYLFSNIFITLFTKSFISNGSLFGALIPTVVISIIMILIVSDNKYWFRGLQTIKNWDKNRYQTENQLYN